jgi:hypothetical protein
MPDNKVKLYKNPNRNIPEAHKPYVPQYQVHNGGYNPKSFHSNTVAPGSIKNIRPTVLPTDNPRAPRTPRTNMVRTNIMQPYAITTPSPIGKGPAPNVGNNMEHMWPSVDSEIIDDISNQSLDLNALSIDNNQYVTDQAMEFRNGLTVNDMPDQFNMGKVIIEEAENNIQKSNSNQSDDLSFIINDLSDNLFLLIVSGTPVCSGPKEEIEEQVRSFIFGENEMCAGEPTPLENILVIKKVKIKVGAFLE